MDHEKLNAEQTAALEQGRRRSRYFSSIALTRAKVSSLEAVELLIRANASSTFL